MSIYGALYASVAGISAQGTAIGIISDNISNINTIGYKAGSQYFSTLVTDSGSTASYAPGGVRATNRQRVSQQGLLTTTNSPTDIAVSGGGLFVVSDGRGGPSAGDDTLYTRAGSFRTDSLGNFVNAGGLYLLAWPLDADGNLPGQGTNPNTQLFTSLDSLQVVNIGSAFGTASSSNKVQVGANLNSAAPTFLGAGDILKAGSDVTNTENANLKSSAILIPNANLTYGDSFDITVPINSVNATYNFEYGGFAISNDLDGGILGATTSTSTFSTATAGDNFTISYNGELYTFEYITTGNARASEGTFKTPQDLVDAIDGVDGLSARLTTNSGGHVNMYVSAEDAREAIVFANGSAGTFVGTDGAPINLFDTDDASVVTAATGTTNFRWNSIDGLAQLVNQEATGISAVIQNGTTSNSAIRITNDDPLTEIEFANSGTSEFLEEFGLTVTGTSGGENISTIVQTYDATAGSIKSMASGKITPDFVRGVTVYDSQGTAHILNLGFLKVGANKWSVEIFAADGDDIQNTPQGERLLATGIVDFNGDGTLKSLDNALTDPLDIAWSNSTDASSITFNFGTIDDKDGLRQYASNSSLDFLTQNGSSIGLLDSVSIDDEGYVIANFNNGQSQRIYKIPLGSFKNADGLIRKANNAYIQSIDSGEVNLKQVGDGDVGKISSSSLESANSELSEELTNMIVAQRAYQASTKVITTASQLLDELNRINS